MAEGFFPEDTFLSDVHIGTFEVPSVKVGCVGGYIYMFVMFGESRHIRCNAIAIHLGIEVHLVQVDPMMTGYIVDG